MAQRTYSLKELLSEEELADFYGGPKPLPPEPKEVGGFVDAIQNYGGSWARGLGTGLEDYFGKGEISGGLQQWGKEVQDENPLSGELFSTTGLKELVGGMVPTVSGALGGAALGTLAGGPIGGVLGGLAGGAAAYQPVSYQNISDYQKAQGYTNPDAKLVGSLLSSGAEAAFGAERRIIGSMLTAAAKKLPKETLDGLVTQAFKRAPRKEGESALKYVLKDLNRVGIVEGVTEVAQSATERAFGGAPMADKDALKDYAYSAAGGYIGGGLFGGAVMATQGIPGDPKAANEAAREAARIKTEEQNAAVAKAALEAEAAKAREIARGKGDSAINNILERIGINTKDATYGMMAEPGTTEGIAPQLPMSKTFGKDQRAIDAILASIGAAPPVTAMPDSTGVENVNIRDPLVRAQFEGMLSDPAQRDIFGLPAQQKEIEAIIDWNINNARRRNFHNVGLTKAAAEQKKAELLQEAYRSPSEFLRRYRDPMIQQRIDDYVAALELPGIKAQILREELRLRHGANPEGFLANLEAREAELAASKRQPTELPGQGNLFRFNGTPTFAAEQLTPEERDFNDFQKGEAYRQRAQANSMQEALARLTPPKDAPIIANPLTRAERRLNLPNAPVTQMPTRQGHIFTKDGVPPKFKENIYESVQEEQAPAAEKDVNTVEMWGPNRGVTAAARAATKRTAPAPVTPAPVTPAPVAPAPVAPALVAPAPVAPAPVAPAPVAPAPVAPAPVAPAPNPIERAIKQRGRASVAQDWDTNFSTYADNVTKIKFGDLDSDLRNQWGVIAPDARTQDLADTFMGEQLERNKGAKAKEVTPAPMQEAPAPVQEVPTLKQAVEEPKAAKKASAPTINKARETATKVEPKPLETAAPAPSIKKAERDTPLKKTDTKDSKSIKKGREDIATAIAALERAANTITTRINLGTYTAEQEEAAANLVEEIKVATARDVDGAVLSQLMKQVDVVLKARAKTKPQYGTQEQQEEAATSARETTDALEGVLDFVYPKQQKDILAREARDKGETHTLASVTQHLNDTYGKGNIDNAIKRGSLIVVKTGKDLSEAVRQAYYEELGFTGAVGMWYPKTAQALYHNGTVHIIAENTAVAETDGVLLHDIGVHAGMYEIFNPAYQNILSELQAVQKRIAGREPATPLEKLVRAAENRIPDTTSERAKPHELMAYFIEEGAGMQQKLPLWTRMVAAVKKWLMSHGFNIDINKPTGLEAAINLARGAAQSWIENSTPGPGGGKTTGKIIVNGKERSRVNSAGKALAATDDGIRNFWKWFGDSKVVDSQGRPLAVYHGTNKDFGVFKNGVDLGGDPMSAQTGLYFIKDSANSSMFSDGEGGNIMPVYLNIRSPLDLTDERTVSGFKGAIAKIIAPRMATTVMREEKLRDGVHQSLITMSDRDKLLVAGRDGIKGIGNVWIAFTPTQIKSAVGNTGAYSATAPSILASTAKGKSEKGSGKSFRDRMMAEFKALAGSENLRAYQNKNNDYYNSMTAQYVAIDIMEGKVVPATQKYYLPATASALVIRSDGTWSTTDGRTGEVPANTADDYLRYDLDPILYAEREARNEETARKDRERDYFKDYRNEVVPSTKPATAPKKAAAAKVAATQEAAPGSVRMAEHLREIERIGENNEFTPHERALQAGNESEVYLFTEMSRWASNFLREKVPGGAKALDFGATVWERLAVPFNETLNKNYFGRLLKRLTQKHDSLVNYSKSNYTKYLEDVVPISLLNYGDTAPLKKDTSAASIAMRIISDDMIGVVSHDKALHQSFTDMITKIATRTEQDASLDVETRFAKLQKSEEVDAIVDLFWKTALARQPDLKNGKLRATYWRENMQGTGVPAETDVHDFAYSENAMEIAKKSHKLLVIAALERAISQHQQSNLYAKESTNELANKVYLRYPSDARNSMHKLVDTFSGAYADDVEVARQFLATIQKHIENQEKGKDTTYDATPKAQTVDEEMADTAPVVPSEAKERAAKAFKLYTENNAVIDSISRDLDPTKRDILQQRLGALLNNVAATRAESSQYMAKAVDTVAHFYIAHQRSSTNRVYSRLVDDDGEPVRVDFDKYPSFVQGFDTFKEAQDFAKWYATDPNAQELRIEVIDRGGNKRRAKIVLEAVRNDYEALAKAPAPYFDLFTFTNQLERSNVNLTGVQREQLVKALANRTSKQLKALKYRAAKGADKDIWRAFGAYLNGNAYIVANNYTQVEFDNILYKSSWGATEVETMLKNTALMDDSPEKAEMVRELTEGVALNKKNAEFANNVQDLAKKVFAEYRAEAGRAPNVFDNTMHFAATSFLIGNVSTAVTQIMSLPILTMSYLGAKHTPSGYGGGYGFTNVAKELSRSLRSISKMKLFLNTGNATQSFERVMEDKLKNANLTGRDKLMWDYVLKEVKEGKLQVGQVMEVTDMYWKGFSPQRRKVNKYTEMFMKPFALSEAYIRMASWVTSFNLAFDALPAADKKRILDAGASTYNDPVFKRIAREADETVEHSQGIYSQWARAPWLQKGWGRALTMFMHYPLVQVQLLKAMPLAGQAMYLALLTALAGLDGIPFKEDLENLLDALTRRFPQVFGRFGSMAFSGNVKQWYVENTDALMQWAGEDGGELARKGLFNAITGADGSGKLGFHGFARGLDSGTGSDIFPLLGPIGGFLDATLTSTGNAADMAMAAALGRDPSEYFMRTLKTLPISAVRNAVNGALVASTGEARSRDGKTVATELDNFDAFMQFLGWRPTESVAEYGRRDRIQIFKDIQNNLVRSYNNQMGLAKADGDTDLVNHLRNEARELNNIYRDAGIPIRVEPNMDTVNELAMDARDTLSRRGAKRLPEEMRKYFEDEIAEGEE